MEKKGDFKEFLIFIDDSNLWISGQKYQGDKLKDANSDPRFRVDLGKILQVLVGNNGYISRAFLYGSVPPPNDTVWKAAKKKNFEVKTYRRSTTSGKEKEVDVALATDLMEMLFTQEDDNAIFVIVTGDRDLRVPMKRVLSKGIAIDLWSWEKSLSIDYRRMANTNPLFKVHTLDDVEPHFSYKSYIVNWKRHRINPQHALVVRSIANNRKSLHAVADEISRLMRLFYITTRAQPASETQDLIIEFPNTKLEVILDQLKKINFDSETCTYASYTSESDQAPKPLDTVNRYQALSTIDEDSLVDAIESSLSLDPEEIDQTCCSDPPAEATPKDDPESDRESCQSAGDSGSLLSGGSWVDVVKRKNFRKDVSHIPCQWGVHCAAGSKCKYQHSDYEREVFRKFPKVKFQKWKSRLCEKHKTVETESKWCPYAHDEEEAWCLKCKMRGHLTKNCAV